MSNHLPTSAGSLTADIYTPTTPRPPTQKKPWYLNLATQIILGLALGIIIGHFLPDIGQELSPLSVAFLKLIKAVVGIVIFCTIVSGIANIGTHAGLGRIGLRAFIYFEVVTTLAMVIGLVSVNLFKPGAGLNIELSSLDAGPLSTITKTAENHTVVSWLLTIIPDTFVSAFTSGNILPVLLVALLTGCALLRMGEHGASVCRAIDRVSETIFVIVGMIMKLAPLAVFGAIAFTVGKYGIHSMLPLAKFLLLFFLTCVTFITIVFGIVCATSGISLWKLIRYLRVELMLAFATASSEAVLPSLMGRLEQAGCKKHIVGFVVPTGFSFNLDGSSMYFIMAIVFVAQACNIPLSLSQEIVLILIFMVTSKGIAGVAGAGFVTLAATLAVYPVVPIAGIVLLLGIDRIMDAMRTFTNLLGNAVATCAIAKWEDARDDAIFYNALNTKQS